MTLLTLAASYSSASQLSYANLQTALSLDTPRDLENLVTDAIYAGLLTGTLNPAQQTVIISSVAPLRDLAPGSVTAMVAELEAWSRRCDGVLQELEAEITKVRQDATTRARSESETAAQIERADRVVRDRDTDATDDTNSMRGGMRGGGRSRPADDGDGDAMDVDGAESGKRNVRSMFGAGRKR